MLQAGCRHFSGVNCCVAIVLQKSDKALVLLVVPPRFETRAHTTIPMLKSSSSSLPSTPNPSKSITSTRTPPSSSPKFKPRRKEWDTTVHDLTSLRLSPSETHLRKESARKYSPRHISPRTHTASAPSAIRKADEVVDLDHEVAAYTRGGVAISDADADLGSVSIEYVRPCRCTGSGMRMADVKDGSPGSTQRDLELLGRAYASLVDTVAQHEEQIKSMVLKLHDAISESARLRHELFERSAKDANDLSAEVEELGCAVRLADIKSDQLYFYSRIVVPADSPLPTSTSYSKPLRVVRPSSRSWTHSAVELMQKIKADVKNPKIAAKLDQVISTSDDTSISEITNGHFTNIPTSLNLPLAYSSEESKIPQLVRTGTPYLWSGSGTCKVGCTNLQQL
ncbi:hypothetical protein SeMB42_g02734 [Synchytrium endobioticum]|uniref:Uncharacterized protein n=1 Tax=Synchytrium endobioticum TaxID=286115 RepID=A0A507DCI6_9FUNG|nr:hypothetical protein SeMB42_g02734 [Synchytrium endobioticum]